MDAAVASLIGAAIGAISGLAGGYLTGRRQSQLERDKWFRARKDEHDKNIRLAVAELTKKLAAGTQEISWLTWKAKYTPDALTVTDIANYNNKMAVLFPDIVGARVIVDAIDKSIHARLTPLINKLYSLDENIALAAKDFGSSRERCTKALAGYYEQWLSLDKEILTRVTEIMKLDDPEVLTVGAAT
jgi:hypothetical protein